MVSVLGFQLPSIFGELAVLIPVSIVGLIIAVWLARVIVALANGRELEDAAERSARWLALVLGGVFAAVMTAIAGSGEALDVVTQFIGSHPFAVSNLAVVGLGAAIFEGVLSLSTGQYVGIALGIVGVTLIVSEVR